MPTDFGVPNAVYRHVFECYTQSFTKSDNTLLILGYTNGQTPEDIKVSDDPQSPPVRLINYERLTLLNVLNVADALITTRENVSSICVDYATDHGAEIYSGLDENVFARPPLREKISFCDSAPLLTIGIPTFNRLKYLRKSLAAICEAVGNDRRVEILVSDNDSTDRTAEFVRAAQHHYSNLIYRKNEENIGGNRNFMKVYSEARGRYVMAIGDDDYLKVETINRLLELIETGANQSLILMRNVNTEDFTVIEGSGTVEYMRQASFWTTYISGIVFEKAAFDEIAAPDKYDGTGLDQVYLQLSVLKRHPKFRVMFGRILREGSSAHLPRGYNYAEVFIKNYFDIVKAEAGLPREDFAREKLRVLNEMLLPWFTAIANGGIQLSLDGLPEIFERYYGSETYYDKAVEQIKRLGILK